MYKYKNTEFWLNDPKSLFTHHNVLEFIPHENMTIEEKLNAIVRFIIYFSLIMYFIDNNMVYIYLALLVLCLSVIYYRNNKNNYYSTNTPECKAPTIHNPYMNRLIFDSPEDEDECKNSEQTLDIIEDKLADTYKNLENVYNKNIQFRQYYKTPENNIVNKQEEYAKWLYGNVGNDKNLSFGNVKDK